METKEVIEKLQAMIDRGRLCKTDEITCCKAIELLDQEPAWWAINYKGEKVAFKDISAERAALLLEMMEHEPCEDAISRQALKTAVVFDPRTGDMFVKELHDIINIIDEMPLVISSRCITGHWEQLPHMGTYKCSNCCVCSDNKSSYCSYCGSRNLEE